MHGKLFRRSHAVANGVHVVSVNRVGFEQDGAMKFWGGSFVSNPFGTVTIQASHENEEVMLMKLILKKQTVTEHTGHFCVTEELIPINRSRNDLLTKKLMVNGS